MKGYVKIIVLTILTYLVLTITLYKILLWRGALEKKREQFTLLRENGIKYIKKDGTYIKTNMVSDILLK